MLLMIALLAAAAAPDKSVLSLDSGAANSETGATEPSQLPDAVRLLIENAIATDNEGDITTVVKIAKASYPQASTEIDKIVQPWLDIRANQKLAEENRTKAQRAVTAPPPPSPVIWTGQGELGGFRSTGTIDELGLAASVNLKRAGPRWTHLFRARVDYRRTDGSTSRESFLAAYEPRLQVSPRTFIYGLTQFERAPYLGYRERYTASAGFGSKIVESDAMTFAIDTGPSFRSTHFISEEEDNRFGWRASSDFDWKLSPTVSLRQDTNAYIETRMQTVNGLFALDTKLVTRLSARFSYDVRYESPTDIKEKRLDTMSKVTLVYNF